ncbi:hypothetical protein [Companilactobacillus halodurans]|uniref:Uncharacterized protein n=1 Tax=Companilactobacillus halodurans TaxID=2584183 RepID=A0A5P0ZRU4_9LACO|nr:hypothetical protein [Companilactobacillus halodurans]MQS76967.1 hypothetical protein [Companilactobacillus halodurans]MQS96391.1 hypothetical protein [Companilactobacillus halodurans]
MRHRRRNRKPLVITLVSVLILIILGVVFFFPLNNLLRNTTGNDTASDKVVKSELVKKVKAKKTGDPKKDKKIDKAASILGKKKMSEIMSAANSQSKTQKLIEDSSSLSNEQAQIVAQEVFSNSDYTPLRNAISKGNWYQAYQQYQKLSDNGQLTQLQQDIKK